MSYTIPCSDTFGRPDANLGATFLDNGLGGTESVAWFNDFGADLKTVGGSAISDDVSLGDHWDVVRFSAPATGQKLTIVCTGLTSAAGVAAQLRYNTSSSHHCLGFANADTSAIYKYTGSFAALVSGGPGYAEDDILEFEAQDDTFKLYKNHALVLSHTDTGTALTSGVFGLYSVGGGAGAKSLIYQVGTPDAGSGSTQRRTMARALDRALNRGFGEN